MDKAPVIGIHLGNTCSCVGIFQRGTVEIIPDLEDLWKTPCFVSFTHNQRLVGNCAQDQVAKNPTNTVFDAKKMIGRRFDDAPVQADMKHWPFNVINDGGKPKIQVDYKNETKTFYPEEISSMVLANMKEAAENYTERTITDAVITVPAHFNDSQRQATKAAGTIAGMNVLGIINEPTAAAIAKVFCEERVAKRNILIFYHGGGSFNLSIFTIQGRNIEVKSTSVNTHLGGEYFTNAIVYHFINKLYKGMLFDKGEMRRLRAGCEAAKITLSDEEEAYVYGKCPFGMNDFRITRVEFEKMCDSLFTSIFDSVKKSLEDANMDKSDIDEIVLLGKSIKIPKVKKFLLDFFNGKKLDQLIGQFMYPGGALAYGATVQAAILKGDKSEAVQGLLLSDVALLSLGVEMAGGLVMPIIQRNTPIPTTQTQTYITDNQSTVFINVYEYEEAMTRKNLLGRFYFVDIPQAPEGVLKIEVTFTIDHDGIMHVSAVDKSTGKKITITNDKGRLSKEEIEKMVRDAKDEDDKQKDRNSARNSLMEYSIDMKKAVKDEKLKHEIFEPDKTLVLDKCDAIMNWVFQNEFAEKEEFEHKQEELEKVCKPIVTRLYY